jgi:hypothetical protein
MHAMEILISRWGSERDCARKQAKVEIAEKGKVLHDRQIGDGLRNKELCGRTQL